MNRSAIAALHGGIVAAIFLLSLIAVIQKTIPSSSSLPQAPPSTDSSSPSAKRLTIAGVHPGMAREEIERSLGGPVRMAGVDSVYRTPNAKQEISIRYAGSTVVRVTGQVLEQDGVPVEVETARSLLGPPDSSIYGNSPAGCVANYDWTRLGVSITVSSYGTPTRDHGAMVTLYKPTGKAR